MGHSAPPFISPQALSVRTVSLRTVVLFDPYDVSGRGVEGESQGGQATDGASRALGIRTQSPKRYCIGLSGTSGSW